MTGRSGLVARAVRLGAALVLAASLAGCAAPAPDPTPAASAVTTEQSQLLAVSLVGMGQVSARFWLQEAGTMSQDEAAALVASLAWRGIGGYPRHDDR